MASKEGKAGPGDEKSKNGADGPKKETRLGLEVSKSANFSDWYSQVFIVIIPKSVRYIFMQ